MTDDQGKPKAPADRAAKAKARLQRSFPEIQRLARPANAVDVARKIMDPAQSIFRQFADDIQLKDLLAKAEALVANANRTLTKAAPKDVSPAQAFRDETSSNETAKKSALRKTPPKRAPLKKAAPKKTSSKKKKPASKRNSHRRHARAQA